MILLERRSDAGSDFRFQRVYQLQEEQQLNKPPFLSVEVRKSMLLLQKRIQPQIDIIFVTAFPKRDYLQFKLAFDSMERRREQLSGGYFNLIQNTAGCRYVAGS